ncbi:MAG: PPA1309 family protein [Nocardioidaceae bacterium]
MQLSPDSPIRQVTLEVEAHVAHSGWDQPPRLYGLVPTTEILQHEPAAAAELGIDPESAPGTLTPIEQDSLPLDRPLEDVLDTIMWPPQVVGCAVVLERVMLPPDAETQLPADPGTVHEYAANHPDRQEVRIAAAVTRDGDVHCAVRLHHPSQPDADLYEGPELVPGLVEKLEQTLAD